MRRCALSMNTQNAVTPSTITTTISTLIAESCPLLAMLKVWVSACGRPATMPAKMISEIPLPMPRSVICSPSHIRNMLPAVSPITDAKMNPKPGSYTTGTPPEMPSFCSAIAMPKAWNADNPTVPQRVYLVMMRWPACPSFLSCCQAGSTEPIICTTMDAEMYGITPSANSEKRANAPPDHPRHRFRIDARDGDERTQPEHDQRADQEQQALTQLGQLAELAQRIGRCLACGQNAYSTEPPAASIAALAPAVARMPDSFTARPISPFLTTLTRLARPSTSLASRNTVRSIASCFRPASWYRNICCDSACFLERK